MIIVGNLFFIGLYFFFDFASLAPRVLQKNELCAMLCCPMMYK
jgi:hypothetical protein